MIRQVAMISDHASPLASFGGVDAGGQNVYVHQLARHLARKGIEVDVFTRRVDWEAPEVVRVEPGYRVIHISCGPDGPLAKEELLPYMPEFSERMIAFIAREHAVYDVMHAHFWMSGLVAMELKDRLGVPYVVTFHALGKIRRQFQGGEDKFPDARFNDEERIIRDADGLIATCPQERDDLMTLYGAEDNQIMIVPCGVDLQELHAVDRVEARLLYFLPERRPILLAVSRMVPRKGLDTAIEAFAHLAKDDRKNALFVIVGGGPKSDDPELRRLAKVAEEQGVRDDVLFVGAKNRSELKYFYSAADIFLTTPWYEPFGITPLEAMACGVPVVGSRTGGIAYTVHHGKTGLLVGPRQPTQLAHVLAFLLNNPAIRTDMGSAGLARVQALFTWERVAEGVERAYLATRLSAASLGPIIHRLREVS